MAKVDELREVLTDQMKSDLREVELNVLTKYTLADAIREGCGVTEQAFHTYGHGNAACALSAAGIAAQARGFLPAT